MTEHEPARTLACYAVALMHGAKLADFEEQNLIALAQSVGVAPTIGQIAMRDSLQQAEESRNSELEILRTVVKTQKFNNSIGAPNWWQRIRGRS